MDGEKRPQCTCEKTECLRRYCRCFESRWFCDEGCSCQGCRNTQDNEDEVEERVDNIMRKKPDAFKLKIAGEDVVQGKEARVLVRGCNCRKSECKKLYCECYKHKVGCSSRCQCNGCGNSYGAKGASETDRQQVDDNDSSPNDTSGGTPAGSNGTSSAFDDDMFNLPTQTSILDDFLAPTPAPWGVDPQIKPLRDSGHDDIFLKPGDYFQHNVHPQTNQGFVKADESQHNNANSVPWSRGPSNVHTCNVNDGSQNYVNNGSQNYFNNVGRS